MTNLFKRPIILAADVQTEADLQRLLAMVQSDPHAGHAGGNPNVIVKVGLEFVLVHGTKTLANLLRPYHPPIMLDVKLADIGNTNAKALENILSHLTPAILTVSGLGTGGKGIRAVRDVIDKAGLPTQLVATTILTNWSAGDAMDMAPLITTPDTFDLSDWAREIALIALSNGAHGVVCSGHEASEMRKLGAKLVITPGIRPAWAADKGDQTRVMTPMEAFVQGATHLVVGRPITGAAKFGLTPAQAIQKLVDEMPSRWAA